MNIKFSQLPVTIDSQGTDLFPILRDGENRMTPISAIYTFLSGDKLIDIYTSYSNISSQYVLTTSQSAITWNSAVDTLNTYGPNWQAATSLIEYTSAALIISDKTEVPNSSAIKNIVAISQANYDLLTYIDPFTFYIIAS
jgi:hypothetical protein